MRPKALGAWHLHYYTESLNLDYFVLFSSISALVGKPGQGNYVAANAYLDQLAHYRRLKGLTALSINWGVLAEVGMAAQRGMEERLMRIGIGSFTPDEAMQMLAVALNVPNAQLCLINIDWQAFFLNNSRTRIIELRYEHLLEPAWLSGESPLQKFYDELHSRDAQQRLTYIVELLSTWVARIMRLPADNLDTDVPLNNFGLDSLIAVEIRGVIDSQTGVTLSVLEVMQDNSIEQLANKLLARLEKQL
jgi:acyl carrier protein